jgi:nicotinamidase-related amidase
VAETFSIAPKTTALLVMDYQVTIVENYAGDQQNLLSRTASLLAVARKAGLTIIHIVVGFRPGYAEVSPRNLSFSAIRQSGRFLAGDQATAIHGAVAPVEGDIVVTKHRVSAFAGTDLEMILRAKGIEHLILAGIATSGVVLSTTRHAADADYRITIVGDCCADRDEEVHRVLLDKVFPRQAAVVTSDDITAALTRQ